MGSPMGEGNTFSAKRKWLQRVFRKNTEPKSERRFYYLCHIYSLDKVKWCGIERDGGERQTWCGGVGGTTWEFTFIYFQLCAHCLSLMFIFVYLSWALLLHNLFWRTSFGDWGDSSVGKRANSIRVRLSLSPQNPYKKAGHVMLGSVILVSQLRDEGWRQESQEACGPASLAYAAEKQ